MDELIYGINIEEIERITGEDQKVIKRWKKGTRPIPESSRRLLRLYLTGDASALMGDEWKGYRFVGNLLYVPEWRNGFAPHEIRAFFWQVQQVSILKREIDILKKDIEKYVEEINALEIKSDFYRRQLILESRFGLILNRTFC